MVNSVVWRSCFPKRETKLKTSVDLFFEYKREEGKSMGFKKQIIIITNKIIIKTRVNFNVT